MTTNFTKPTESGRDTQQESRPPSPSGSDKREYMVCDQCFSKHRMPMTGSCTLGDCTGTLRTPELLSAASEMLTALKGLYGYEARRSSPDTAWERPMMRVAREAIEHAEANSSEAK